MLGEQIRQERLRLAIPILGALLLLNRVIGMLAWQDRQARLEAAALQARLATQIVMQRSEAKLRHLNDLLTGIGEVLGVRQGVPVKPDLYVHRLLVRRNALTDGVHWIFLVRPDGFLAESSRQFPVLPVNVADREYFSRQLEHWDQGLYLGAPLRARLQGESFIPVSRRVSNDGGLFLGVAAAGLNPDALLELIRAQSLPPGFQAGIFLPEGIALACLGMSCDTAGLQASPLFARFLPGEAETGEVRGAPLLDQTAAVGSYGRSQVYPLVVAVQVPQALVHQEWLQQMRQQAPAALILNLALVALALVAHRQFRRRRDALHALERANQELERRVAERTDLLQASEARARAFMNTARDAVVVINDRQQILEFNPAAEQMFGYQGSEVLGQDLSLLMPEEMAEAHARQVGESTLQESAQRIGKGQEIQALRRDGSRFPVEVSVGSALVGSEPVHVGILRDITERKEAEWQLQRLATVDGLTGVFNRRALMEQGEQMLALARRYDWPLAVLMLDADYFKKVNDSYGHHVGDQLLRLLAERIGAVLRSTDILGRLGGEEFGLVLPETGAQGAAELGQRLLRVVREASLPLEDGGVLRFTVSIGGATLEAGDGCLDDLFRRADACLYQAKHGGRDRLELALPGQG